MSRKEVLTLAEKEVADDEKVEGIRTYAAVQTRLLNMARNVFMDNQELYEETNARFDELCNSVAKLNKWVLGAGNIVRRKRGKKLYKKATTSLCAIFAKLFSVFTLP